MENKEDIKSVSNYFIKRSGAVKTYFYLLGSFFGFLTILSVYMEEIFYAIVFGIVCFSLVLAGEVFRNLFKWLGYMLIDKTK